MKFLKLKSIIFILIAITLMVTTACNQDGKDIQSPRLENERITIMNYLLNEGYEKEQIYFEEDAVLYSACEHNQYKYSIAEMLTIIEETQKPPTDAFGEFNEIGLRSQVNDDKNDILRNDKVSRLKYKFDSSVSNEWKEAIRLAVDKINTMSNVNGVARCAVKFIEEPRPGYSYDTKFKVEDLGTSSTGKRVLGRAGQPQNGVIDNSILLDDDNPSISSDKKVAVVIHEIYHALGFRHTATNDGLLVGGTGRYDSKSIMLKSLGSNLVPTVHDIKALKKVYPTWLRKPELKTAKRVNSNTDVAFTYKNIAANHPYFWIKAVAYHSPNRNAAVASKWYKVNDLSSKQEDLIMKNIPPNAKYISVRAYNYKTDLYSNWSVYKGI